MNDFFSFLLTSFLHVFNISKFQHNTIINMNDVNIHKLQIKIFITLFFFSILFHIKNRKKFIFFSFLHLANIKMDETRSKTNKKMKKILKNDLKKQYKEFTEYDPVLVHRDYIEDTINILNNFTLLTPAKE